MNMCCLNLLFTCLIALLTYSRSGDWTGLLAKLCDILMASGVPADVLTETINTVAEVIRGNQYNQEYFASVMAPSTPPRYSDRAFSSRLPLTFPEQHEISASQGIQGRSVGHKKMNKSGNRLGKVAEFLLLGKFVLSSAITNAGGGELQFTACAAIQNFCEHPWSVFELVTLCVVELLLRPGVTTVTHLVLLLAKKTTIYRMMPFVTSLGDTTLVR